MQQATHATAAIPRIAPAPDLDDFSLSGCRSRCTPEFWRDWELELLRPRLIVAVGGLALRRLLGITQLTDAIGERFERGGIPVVPLPHPSGASSWPNVPANKVRLERALALVRTELAGLGR